MNRKIKFRAWLPTIKKMTYAHTIDQFVMAGWSTHDVGGMIYLQYTGLKDKHGKEIYEGDIVKAFIYEIDEHFMCADKVLSEHIAEVYWDELAAGWGLRCDSFERGCELLSGFDGFEVIGNIHETPHLLRIVQGVQEGDATEENEIINEKE